MLLQAAFAAARQVLSPDLRRILWKSIGLTVALLVLIWLVLTRLVSYYLDHHSLSASYPALDGYAEFLTGFGLLVALVYLIPAVSAVVAGYFLDDVAEVVERKSFPGDPPGEALPMGRALLYGLRFAGLSLLVNLAALMVFLIPGVNIGVFFIANAYLLGREYFELAAGRFRPMKEAGCMRVENRLTVLLAGAVIAALLFVPIVNLLTPLFGVAMMVYVHKGLARRSDRWGLPAGSDGTSLPGRLPEPRP
ncbi:sulfate transporter family protein [Microvirga pudoricolor]|uniref:sulfate transporter family protein n=1 Tax=Microvirga pudoricolor TaxID=2778729 RepID=UPI001950298C|nr:sulfate transporter family protein [Microvirga pudoricolor]MBM6594007.1 sulfate transporter family protein [Microvirga pudoricolor]